MDIELFNAVCWYDSYLDRIEIDLENIVVSVTSYQGTILRINGAGFIGIRYCGQWDESVIAEMKISHAGQVIEENRLAVKQNNSTSNGSVYPGDGVRAYDADWCELFIKLIDGVEIHIVCSAISVEEYE